MGIPTGITLTDIKDAAQRLDEGALHSFGSPVKYIAVVNGKQYPPKALVGLAARRVLGHDLSPADFSSGTGQGQAVAVLESLGVQIIPASTDRAPAASAWLFQGNPDRFDVDGYLASTKRVLWLVRQHATRIKKGDVVYLWRNQGRVKAIPGVVAVGVIDGPAEEQPDAPESVAFWRDQGEAEEVSLRVPIRLIEVATKKGVLKPSWLAEDPICRDLPNLRARQGTNFALSSTHAERLARLWSKTGDDFDRADLLYSLRAYANTYGSAVSKLAGSPVATTALTTGRAVSSIYSKVMNFRALDPRVEGEGQRNAGQPTKDVWDEFWTGESLDEVRLAEAIAELETPGTTADSAKAIESEIVAGGGVYSKEGMRRMVTHLRIERNRKVVADAKAKWFIEDPWLRCSVCEMSFLETYGSVGEGFIEAHHREPLENLSEAHTPVIEDLVPVCSNCHRMIHRSGGTLRMPTSDNHHDRPGTP